jgi:hypothetical protein
VGFYMFWGRMRRFLFDIHSTLRAGQDRRA